MSEEFSYTGDDVLTVMSKYAVNRNNFIEKLIRRSFGLNNTTTPHNLLEIGAGKGEFINRFKHTPHIKTAIVEPDMQYFNELSKSHQGYESINSISEKIDYAYAIDVMEHIENDTEVLKELYAKLADGGKLLIYVPARMELYSQFDRNIGHFRRYTKSELNSKVREAGFTIETSTYHEILGYFAAFFNKFSQSGDLNPKAVAVYDKFLVPLTNFIERFLYIPIGKSLYVIAKKNG
jgi:SAM-dependent methyltransferase